MAFNLDGERRSMWVYPWDALDAGVDSLARRARDEWGLTGLSPTLSYHNAKFLLPKSSTAKVFLSGGSAVYFRPDESKYLETSIRPVVSPRSELLDVWDDLAGACRRNGLTVTAWTVVLHNSLLGDLHPELTEVNAFGDRYPWALCPSQPQVRAYAIGLIRDIVENHGPDEIDLESAAFHGLSHGHHHELTGIVWGPVEETLMGLCFCDACRMRAKERGIDAEQLREDVKTILTRRFANESALAPADLSDLSPVLALTLGRPELLAYVQTRLETVATLHGEIRDAIGRAPTELSIAAATFVKPAANAWLEGHNLAASANSADSVVLVSYFNDPRAVASDIQIGQELVGDVDKLKLGLALLHPLTDSPANLRAKVDVGRAMGVRRFSFYNYGFLSEGRLSWLSGLVD